MNLPPPESAKIVRVGGDGIRGRQPVRILPPVWTHTLHTRHARTYVRTSRPFRWFPSPSVSGVLTRVALDQFVFAPAFCVAFFAAIFGMEVRLCVRTRCFCSRATTVSWNIFGTVEDEDPTQLFSVFLM